MSGELLDCNPELRESGITISSEIKKYMLASKQFSDVLARHGALSDSVVFIK
ncbi:MAG: hypothetical protein WC620_06270 [Methanoregula sp.]|jgi:hypothetical protein